MSTTFLATSQIQEELSYSRKRQRDETQQQLNNTQNQTLTFAEQIKSKRDKALQQPIKDTNLGFQMMLKMGCNIKNLYTLNIKS